jgi:phosphatidylinositol kinase/protein kinase (PI-3  family)
LILGISWVKPFWWLSGVSLFKRLIFFFGDPFCICSLPLFPSSPLPPFTTGNFKSKFGIKRETMPFIFTEQMKFAIGPRFNEFESLACDAYKTLRRHANLLITMFSLMVSSGMPELMTDDDIGWLRDKLMLDYAEDQASNDFKRQIEAAYKNTRVKLNDVAHLLRHVG